MVTIELRAQSIESTRVTWETIARLRADGQQVEVEGDASRLDRSLPVISLKSGAQLRYEDDPEEWARSLPAVYHAPDFLAVVVADTDPPPTRAAEREHVFILETSRRHGER